MKRRRAPLFVRLSTLLFLPVWIAALVACSLESLPGHCGSHAVEASEHSGSHSDHDHDSAPAPAKAPHSEGFCASLASTVFTSTDVVIAPPHSEVHVAFDSTVSSPTPEKFSSAVFLRQAERRIGVFRPDVCTSPANRSHAPPLLS